MEATSTAPVEAPKKRLSAFVERMREWATRERQALVPPKNRKAGMILKYSDRSYQVQADGSYRRLKN